MNEKKKIKLEFEEVTAWKIATAVLALLFIISIATGGLGVGSRSAGTTGAAAQQQVPTAAPQQIQQPQYVEVSLDDDPVLGDPKAPVTIIEFSDYQCPFCGRFFAETLPEIKKNYISTGKAKLVYRDLPLPFHTEADEAAIAANCAGEQGMYFEMHDAIFENTASWIGQADPEAALTKLATSIGVNENKFSECYNDPKTRKEVEADYSDASRAGATGTPTFFINGRKLVGAQPYAAFEAVIEDEL